MDKETFIAGGYLLDKGKVAVEKYHNRKKDFVQALLGARVSWTLDIEPTNLIKKSRFKNKSFYPCNDVKVTFNFKHLTFSLNTESGSLDAVYDINLPNSKEVTDLLRSIADEMDKARNDKDAFMRNEWDFDDPVQERKEQRIKHMKYLDRNCSFDEGEIQSHIEYIESDK